MRTWLALMLVIAAVVPATAAAETNDTGPCVPVNDPPTSDSDTNWSVRICHVPDFDQRRTAATNLGQPTPISVDGLPGDGNCHCILTSVADLYAWAQAPLQGADTYATFDWAGRGPLPPPASGPNYDTSTYTSAEVTAYQGTTKLLDGLGTIADVSYGQDAAHDGCGTSWFNVYDNLPKVAAKFGDQADDYAFSEFGVDAGTPTDMALALEQHLGVAFTYGFYTLDPAHNTPTVDAATERSGGHANAIVGVSRSGDSYTFETSDPASSAESSEDTNRQSQFARTIWTATERKLKVGSDPAATLYKLEDTDRYVDAWITFRRPNLVARIGRDAVLVRSYVPARDLPDPAPDRVSKYRFPGAVLDAVEDPVASRVLALVATKGSTRLWVGDERTGRTQALDGALPAGARHLAALPDGSTAVLGSGLLRTLDRTGRELASHEIAGGGADMALNPRTGGVVVLSADRRRLLRFGPGLVPAGERAVKARAGRLSVTAAGGVRIARRALATPTGGMLVLAHGRATVHKGGRTVPGRVITGLKNATLLDLSAGAVLRRPPAGAVATDFADAPLARPVAGYQELDP